MTKSLLFILLIISIAPANAQLAGVFGSGHFTRKDMDSMHYLWIHENTDTGRVKLLNTLARGSFHIANPDSAHWYARQALQLSQKINFISGGLEAFTYIIRFLWQTGNYPEAVRVALNYLQLAEKTSDTAAIYNAVRNVSLAYLNAKDYQATLIYARRNRQLVLSRNFTNEQERRLYGLAGYMNIMGSAFDGLNQMDSALYYEKLAYRTALGLKINQDQLMALATESLGRSYFKIKDYERAYSFYLRCIPYAQKTGFRFDLVAISQLGIAKIFNIKSQIDSALHYGKLSLNTCQHLKIPAEELEAATLLKELYVKKRRFDSAYLFQARTIILKDSLYNQDKIKQIESIKYTEALKQQQLVQERLERQINEANLQKKLQQANLEKQSLLQNGLVLSIFILIFVGLIVFRNITLKRKNEKIQSEKKQAALQQQATELEMQALRAQMNPHFIFNSLNSINRFILQNERAKAADYLTKFSKLVRLILQNSQAALIPLESELEALQLYLELEAVRFEYRFEHTIVVDGQLDVEVIEVPPLLIQPYVENAIWHGLMHKEEKGHLKIEIYQQDQHTLCCKITDDGIGRKKTAELKTQSENRHKSMGMKITASRIAVLQQNKHIDTSIKITDLVLSDETAGGTEVLLKIPVLND